MKLFQWISILILAGFAAVYSQGMINLASQVYGKATFVGCNGNPKYVQNMTCKLKAKSWEHNLAFYEADIVDVLRNLTLRLEFYKLTNQFRPFLLNVTFNYCSTVEKGRISNAYTHGILSVIFKYSNLNHKCPYTGHLYIHNAYADLNVIPFYIPLGTYKLIFNFYEGWPYVWVSRTEYAFRIAQRKNATRLSAVSTK